MLEKIFGNDKLIKKENIIYLLMLVFVISGVIGFIYEIIFYRIDLGYFENRGTTFGPWIPVYGFGSLLIVLICYRLKKNPLVVFLLSALITGAVEYGTAWFCDKILHQRYWDYNVEIWNFGNINGYICFRSVFLFALAGVFLIYVLIPMVNKLFNKYNLKVISCILCSLFVLDIILWKIIY